MACLMRHTHFTKHLSGRLRSCPTNHSLQQTSGTTPTGVYVYWLLLSLSFSLSPLSLSLFLSLSRNFLRLGDPLCCKINDYDKDELTVIAENIDQTKDTGVETGEESKDTKNKDIVKAVTSVSDKIGLPLSLARIQSLVSMTTPRDGILYGGSKFGSSSPPFIEFDMSLDGFGCLFLPSVFPQVSTWISYISFPWGVT